MKTNKEKILFQGVSNLAVVALEKLLHYDLAAKYWHMGSLSQTDVIKDGFYDTGAHKPGDDFKPIKFLLDRKVSLDIGELGDYFFTVSTFVYLSVCLSICLSVCLRVFLAPRLPFVSLSLNYISCR